MPLGTLTGADATGLAHALNSFFKDFGVTTISSSDKENDASTLCVASREKNKKPGECTKDKNSSPERCALNDIVALADDDGFIGVGLNSNFVVLLKSLSAADIAQSLPYPSPDFELRNPYGNYLMLVPLAGATALDSGKNGGIAKQAAGIKHDLELIDDLYGIALKNAQLTKDLAASVQAYGNSDPNDPNFQETERNVERWLAQHTVRLSFLDPRDVALTLSNLSKDWSIEVRSFGSAVTILPSTSPSLRVYGAYVAADAIERDTIFRRRLSEAKAAEKANAASGGGKTATSDNPGATTGATPPAPDSHAAAATNTSKSGSNATTGAGASPATNAANASNTTAAAAKTGTDTATDATNSAQSAAQNKNPGPPASAPEAKPPAQQPLRFDAVVRLYHLRLADKIADAINAASPDGKPLVKALDNSGNNDLILILPSPAGGADQSTPIRRAIALLDLPRPQLSLQVWSYQISAEETSDDPRKAKGPANVQQAFEELRSAVNDANRIMAESLQNGFGQILDDASEARERGDSIFDPTLERYLTGHYDDCVMRDSYCLGFLDALSVPKGANRAVNASLTRLLLYLISVSDTDAASLAQNVIDAMQPENCPANLDKLENEQLPLCFGHFADQLNVVLQPRNLHILRAALLDFLFEYKWTLVYPNDFVPYDLQRTAHLLDSLFGPIIDAFNEDLDDYVLHKLEKVARKVEDQTDFQKTGLSTRGMVQVAALSGSKASVDAKVNNYFDITPPLTLNDILNTGNQSNVASSLKASLEPKEIMALQALANIGSRPQITAEVTKEAKLIITPTTLDTASSAQLDVDFEVSEPSPPSTVNQKSAQKDLLDRVADHHVNTHVRVESLKLFQVSAFTMELTHPQRPVPLPILGWGWQATFGSVPGLNKFFMIPRAPRTQDNRSVAIVRAVVVPTAMDLGLGLPFMADRVLDPVSEATDPMFSVAQSGGRLRPFHKELMRCIQSGKTGCLDANSPNRVRLSSMREDLRDATAP